MNKWGYGPVQAERYHTCDTFEEAYETAKNEYPDQSFDLAYGEESVASDFTPTADWILDQMANSASDQVGEVAEDWPPEQISEEAKEELQGLLDAWAEKHCPCSFWTASASCTIDPDDDLDAALEKLRKS